MLVMKFGGASTQSASGIAAVVRIILDHRSRTPLVVVSAVGKTTRAIDRAARLAADGKGREAQTACEELVAMHRDLATAALDVANAVRAIDRIDAIASRLLSLIEGIAIVRELSPRSLDSCLVLGEHLAVVIISEAVRASGADVNEVAAEWLMVTDNAHGHAAPMPDVIKERAARDVMPALSAGTIVMTEGYVGGTIDGTPTTMGMESSDYSATLLGVAIGAGEVQIWTNVDGMMTVDPRICAGARSIPVLSYDEAEELAALGAKVLHPRTIGPVRDARIPLTVRNIGDPAGLHTRIHHATQHRGPKGMAVVGDLLRVPPQHAQNAQNVEYHFSLMAARHEVHWIGAGDPASSSAAIAAVSIIGDGVGRDAALLRSVLDAIASAQVEGVCFGASARSMSILIRAADAANVVDTLHGRFLVR